MASNQGIPGGHTGSGAPPPGGRRLTDLWLPLLRQLPRIIPGNAHVVQHAARQDDLGSLCRRVQEFTPRPGQAEKPGLEKTYGQLNDTPASPQGPVVIPLCWALGVPDWSHQPRQLRVTSIP